MSSIYHTEPPTQGKVVIKTSFGEIDIELWPKEAPLACRNFVQLALEGYYDNTEVVRAIKGFMVQMGDPTGTGEGGASIWGKPFKDEIHGRIKFNHRGQLAMANSNKPHSNQSQFFITLDACDWLNGKHTIFGKVTGSTMFNVIRIGDADVGLHDKPIDPIRILYIEVIANPFDDIVPRVTKKVVDIATKDIKPKDDRIKAVKDKKLLSFAHDDEDEDDSSLQVKFRSVHDLKKRHSKRHEDHGSKSSRSDSNFHLDEDDAEKDLKAKILEKRVEQLQKQTKNIKSTQQDNQNDDEDHEDRLLDRESMLKMDREQSRGSELQKKSEEFLKTRAELLKSRRAVNVMTGAEASQYREETAYRELATPLEQRRMKYVKRKNEFGDRSEETLAKLQKFTETLRNKKIEATSSQPSAIDKIESYHGQVLDKDSDNENDSKDWFVGKLKCKKHIDEQYRYQDNPKDRRDDYVVIDPKRK